MHQKDIKKVKSLVKIILLLKDLDMVYHQFIFQK